MRNNILIEMLCSRGYIQIQQFERIQDSKDLQPYITCKHNENDVVIYICDKIGIGTIRSIMKEYESRLQIHVILIYNNGISSFSIKHIEKENAKKKGNG